MDNMLASRFEDYADFDREQREWIRQATREFHDWHRVNELPALAAIMTDIADRVAQPQPPVPREQVAAWTEAFDARTEISRRCNPLYRAGNFLRNVTDEQVQQIDEHFDERYQDFLEEYEDQTEAERAAETTKTGAKWLGRMGLDLTDTQKQKLNENILAQAGSRGRFFRLWHEWSEELVAMLQRRDQTSAAAINRHLVKLDTLSEADDPEHFGRNRARWIDYATYLANDLSPQQRNEFVSWLRDTARILRELSQDRENFVAPQILPTQECHR